jgi:hypothetical protein
MALMLVLSEQLHEAEHELQKQARKNYSSIEDLGVQVNDQAKQLQTLIDHTRRKLFGLRECVEDLHDILGTIRRGDCVLFQHFGLDMTQAWQYFEPLVREHPNLTKINYQLLILTENPEEIGQVDQEVRDWCNSVPRMTARIKADLNQAQEIIRANQRALSFEVKQYAAVPALHGFMVKVAPDFEQCSNAAPVVCYMALCRWGGVTYRTYNWGEPQYYKVTSNTVDPVLQDLLVVYIGYFNHFWLTQPKSVFHHTDSNATPDSSTTTMSRSS